ncbi:hypothetical protein TorRG33x02_351670 [Trema orientale]|uniref:Uncharacterized protein n=1 Tax=Trema orientale TaxID=63057 RepID=A0A2P5AFC8_TREOI|nr:hypothetical protein TorRG33x02_351670 [Trema orientale]
MVCVKVWNSLFHPIATEFPWEIFTSGYRRIRCGTGNEVVGVLRHDASKLATPHNKVHVGRCSGYFARGAQPY